MTRVRLIAVGGVALALLGTPAVAFEYGPQQLSAIANIAQAQIASDFCPGMERIEGAVAAELKQAGFVADPSSAPEFERKWRENLTNLHVKLSQNSYALCSAIWQRLGPGGMNERQMLTRRVPR